MQERHSGRLSNKKSKSKDACKRSEEEGRALRGEQLASQARFQDIVHHLHNILQKQHSSHSISVEVALAE